MGRSSLAVLATCWFLSTPARADDSPFRLLYRAPPECPDASEFARQVLGHSERGRLVTDQSLARTMQVTIRKRPRGYQGELEFFDLDSERVQRELTAPGCPALVEALVLVTALAIDAQEPPEPWAPGLEAPEEYIAPELPKFDEEPVRAPPARAFSRPRPMAPRPELLVGAQGRIDTAAVPGVGWGVLAFVAVARFYRRERLRLGLGWGTSTATTKGEHARFDWLTVTADGCPLGIEIGAIELLPCAALEVGGLRGKGQRSSNITSPEANLAAWVAVGVSARLRAPIGHWVALELEAGPTVPLTRPRFEFHVPEVPVFRPPSVGLAAGLGLGFRLP